MKISVDEAKPDKLFYVVANTVVYRKSDGRCLILKRDEREKVHPGFWANIGGKLEHGDFDLNNPSSTFDGVPAFEDALSGLIEREVKEEAGVSIELPAKYMHNKVFIRPDGVPVMLIIYAAIYKDGEVKPEPGAFTDYAWVNETEVDDYECIKGVADEVKQAIKLLKKLN